MKANSGPRGAAIEEIRSPGRDVEPVVPILRHGLQDKLMAQEVEAAMIDTIGLENLTNLCRGKHIERACRLGRLLPQRNAKVALPRGFVASARVSQIFDRYVGLPSSWADLSRQSMKPVGRRRLIDAVHHELPLADHVHEFDAGQDVFCGST